MIAMAVSFGIKSWIEGGVIAAVIGINVVVGFFQEFSAEKTMNSLRSLSSPSAVVVRDGKSETISTADLVPGDKIELKTGDTVPADVRYVYNTLMYIVIAANVGPKPGRRHELRDGRGSLDRRISPCCQRPQGNLRCGYWTW